MQGALLFALSVILGSEAAAKEPVFTKARDKDGSIRALPAPGLDVAVFHYWASWCRPCRQELPKLAAFMRSDRYRALKGLSIYVLAVDDKRTELAPFLERYGVADMGWSLRGELEFLKRQTGSSNLPATLIYDARAGRVVERWFGAYDWESEAATKLAAALRRARRKK